MSTPRGKRPVTVGLQEDWISAGSPIEEAQKIERQSDDLDPKWDDINLLLDVDPEFRSRRNAGSSCPQYSEIIKPDLSRDFGRELLSVRDSVFELQRQQLQDCRVHETRHADVRLIIKHTLDKCSDIETRIEKMKVKQKKIFGLFATALTVVVAFSLFMLSFERRRENSQFTGWTV